jgi:hypothetical protein
MMRSPEVGRRRALGNLVITMAVHGGGAAHGPAVRVKE